MNYREENDTMGTVRIPLDAYYGPQTQRAKENFVISGLRLPPVFIYSLALIKQCSARINRDLGLMDEEIAGHIVAAAQEVMDGTFADQFVVDVFQTGSGTSTNMNMNEVIASRANELITGKKGGKAPVHPNDHVNLGQSSNDVMPTTLHVSALTSIKSNLMPSLRLLHETLLQKARQFVDIKKIGRTHLQDAVPMTLGQEFSGYARQIELGIQRMSAVEKRLSELAIGGTAVGTGINTHHEFASRVVELIRNHTGLPFEEAENHFEAQAARDAAVEASGVLKIIAVSLIKIANDIRWLASGPRCGLGEISIPSLQPGSSIMPGKVNPVIPEVVLQVAAQVVGNDTSITIGGQSGNFELNVMLPLIAHNLLQSIHLLSTSARVFAEKCLSGALANRKNCMSYIEKSLSLATGLVPHIGYDRAAAIAKKAQETGTTVREVAVAEGILSKQVLDQVFGALETGE
jgi:fumarate hydratase class II